MNQLIENYIKKMKIEDVNHFAIQNNIYLSRAELEFTYAFIKKNGMATLNSKNLNLNNYRHQFSEENFKKISKLLDIYSAKYKSYL